MPPLKDRKSDIPLLSAHFLKETEEQSPHPVPRLAGEAVDVMLDYSWPGNVRELKNVIQFAVVRSRGKTILPAHLPMEITKDANVVSRSANREPEKTLQNFKGKLNIESVQAALKKSGGNKSKAARILCVGRATLYRFIANNKEIKEFADKI